MAAAHVSVQASAGLTKTGPGTLVLGAANSIAGPINVNRGSLTVTTNLAVNSATAINFNDDRTLSSPQTYTVDLGNSVDRTITPPINVSAFSPTSFGTAFSTNRRSDVWFAIMFPTTSTN